MFGPAAQREGLGLPGKRELRVCPLAEGGWGVCLRAGSEKGIVIVICSLIEMNHRQVI